MSGWGRFILFGNMIHKGGMTGGSQNVEIAVAKKHSGMFNCAQSVACTYCGSAGVDEATMKGLMNAFGSGMGSMDGTCGALVGAGAVLGMARGDRVAAMRDMKIMMSRFKELNGAVTCRELKGIDTGKPLSACNDCVACAARLLEELL